MSKYVTVVTNPELGWDCVCGVYDENTSEQDIRKEWGEDVVLHTRPIKTLPNEDEVTVSRGCCDNCGEGFDNEEDWLYNTNCELCGEPIPEHLIIKKIDI